VPVTLSRSTTTPVKELVFSADGSHLLARSPDRVEIWKTSQPGEGPVTFHLDGEIGGAGLSADGTRAFAWNGNAVAVWETAIGGELLRAAPTEAFHGGALSANGGRVALLDGKFQARVWDVRSGQPFPPILSQLAPLDRLALDGSGERLTLSGASNDLSVFDVASGLPVSPPMKHHYEVEDLEISPGGSRTASYGRDDVVRVWDARTGRAAMSGLPLGDLVRTGAGLAFSRDSEIVLAHTRAQRDAPETISVWRRSVTMEPQRHTVEGARDLDAARISPDGNLACLGLFPDARCYVYELGTGRVLLDRKVEGGPYVHLLTPDSKRYYVLTEKGWLYGWSLETGKELWPPNHQPGQIRPAALSPDGTRIIAGHNDGHIRIYDTANGQLVQTLDHPGEIKTLHFAEDGSGRFVSGSTDGLAHTWDLRTGRMLQTFAGHADTIISAVWSPDGRRIATGSFDRTARVWDAATGRPVGAVLRHNGSLAQLEFSPDGTRLATACRDGTARLWNPRTGQPLSPPLLQGSACESALFTRDGSTLLVRDHDGFRFWDTATAEPVTVHYPEPVMSGIGMDSESYQAILTGDGRHVLLGASMNYGAYWSIPQPRGRAPAWLPDFLEMLAQVRVNESGEAHPLPTDDTNAVLNEIRSAPAGDAFAAWAREIVEH
jgi:WD40 repeat protein